MNDEVKRFDMKKKPVKCRPYLVPIVWLISFFGTLKHKTKIRRTGVKGLKPPYVLLCNHNAFFDMSVSAAATFPHVGNYVVAIDGFIGREWLLRSVGCICKRKFTSDLLLVRQLSRVMQMKGIAAIYPEARYSLCGTTAPLPEALGPLCKLLKVPVATLICHGHHINHPFWNTRHERGVKPTEAEFKLLFTKEQLNELSADEINRRLVEEFKYDDFEWQWKNKINVDCPDRAEGLEKVLYQCPHCKREYRMASEGDRLYCRECGKSWRMSEYGRLGAEDGETEFPHIPDWYEWERENVKAEVAAGTYSSGELSVEVESLPNAKGYIKLGRGTMIHDMNGFYDKVRSDDGKDYCMEKKVPSLYSCHIEYSYLCTHGDCVDLNTLDDTWYVYPDGEDFSVTKMAIATEELYYNYRRKTGKPCEKGLA